YGVVYRSDNMAAEFAEVQVRVSAAADEGKANKAVCKLLAECLDIPKTRVEIESGTTSRYKRIAADASSEVVNAFIGGLPRL
ncbi:MAG: DUF167 domain-containing protein, partial [Eggerthellaceae bacterium]|nr:DUF167 domain-containing protein [Eggerthellaceae bacterium]